MSGLALAVLAAGRGERFGGGKLDARLDGRAVGAYALDAARAAGAEHLAAVVGPDAPGFVAGAGDFVRVVNPRAAEGIGTSVAAAAQWARGLDAAGLLLVLADMPRVTGATLARLAQNPTLTAVRYPDGAAGIPARFPREWFDRLATLDGDRGARGMLRNAQVTLIEVAPGELVDIDRPEDLGAVALRR